jgi:hypothetical protein
LGKIGGVEVDAMNPMFLDRVSDRFDGGVDSLGVVVAFVWFSFPSPHPPPTFPQDKTRYQWMYEDGNYHDADMELLKDSPMVQHDIRTGNYKPPKLGYYPYHGTHVTNLLIQAVKNGDFKGIMQLFRTTRVDPNTQDEKGNTALHYAHELALAQIICLLGTHHADFTIRNKAGRTPYEEYEEAIVEQRGEPWMNLVREKVIDDIITAQYRFR